MQVYYTAGFVLHYVVPRLLPVKSVQRGQPRKGQVASEALYSLGGCAGRVGSTIACFKSCFRASCFLYLG